MSWESKGTPLFTDKALFLLGGKGDGGGASVFIKLFQAASVAWNIWIGVYPAG